VWFAWLGVHLWALAQPSLRLSVFVQWLWMLLTGQRGSRLIVNQGSTVDAKQGAWANRNLTSSFVERSLRIAAKRWNTEWSSTIAPCPARKP